ncbi:hypothetical protein SAMN02745157_1537 [Kaistia soli DSM 19436]|uniref:Sialate O-acetylesterase domain-containing protein n=1 Tax=Kaistia soli DSM 19436 TaxID=1122133 RepID=A0A1M4YJD5_9HYPH|nr:sialate O-acetylesterase [Kaistia soli]SHF05841.1 hypothetical protein SAMN02745157_1537 [Kaistia soli DSM 19436]
MATYPHGGASSVFRDFDQAGNPVSGVREPLKNDIRDLLAFYETLLNVLEGATGDAAAIAEILAAFANKADKGTDVATGARAGVAGANIASAATTDLGAATGDFAAITGTTTISSLGTAPAGIERTVYFTGVLTLTHSGTLVLPTGANITTAGGDVAVFRSHGGGAWRCVSFLRANGVSVGLNKAAAEVVIIGADDNQYVTSLGVKGALDARINPIDALLFWLDSRISPIEGGLAPMVDFTGSDDSIPFFVDDAYGLLLGVSKSTGLPLGSVLDKIVTDLRWKSAASEAVGAPLQNLLVYRGSSAVLPIIVDANYGLVLGVDTTTGVATGSMVSSFGSGGSSIVIPRTDRTGIISYGQSLSVGAQGQPPLSTSQPYSNLTFIDGPKAAVGTGTAASKPLVEDSLAEGAVGTGNRGETPCSGMANYAVQLAALENGVIPSDFVVFSSAPGQGGRTIAELSKGTSYYDRLIGHVTAAKALATAAGKSYSVPVIGWIQGETDCDNATSRAAYLASLLQLVSDLNTDIRPITGQSSAVHLVIYQTSYKAVTSSAAIALAQMDAVAQSSHIHFGTPIYDLAFNAGDQTHLDNISYLRLGRRLGRAAKQLVIDQRVPDCVWPVSATAKGTALHLAMRAPTPLAIDTTNLAAATNNGFKVIDDTGTLALSGIAVDGAAGVNFTLNRALGANPKIRYALDYLGSGLHILGGASGNLRDTTAGTAKISGTDYPLWHVAPAFELPITVLDAST